MRNWIWDASETLIQGQISAVLLLSIVSVHAYLRFWSPSYYALVFSPTLTENLRASVAGLQVTENPFMNSVANHISNTQSSSAARMTELNLSQIRSRHQVRNQARAPVVHYVPPAATSLVLLPPALADPSDTIIRLKSINMCVEDTVSIESSVLDVPLEQFGTGDGSYKVSQGDEFNYQEDDEFDY